jgi:hypothetical protein
MDIKLKTKWVFQGKLYNPGDTAKSVPAHVIEDIKKAGVEFDEVKAESKPLKV